MRMRRKLCNPLTCIIQAWLGTLLHVFGMYSSLSFCICSHTMTFSLENEQNHSFVRTTKQVGYIRGEMRDKTTRLH